HGTEPRRVRALDRWAARAFDRRLHGSRGGRTKILRQRPAAQKKVPALPRNLPAGLRPGADRRVVADAVAAAGLPAGSRSYGVSYEPARVGGCRKTGFVRRLACRRT